MTIIERRFINVRDEISTRSNDLLLLRLFQVDKMQSDIAKSSFENAIGKSKHKCDTFEVPKMMTMRCIAYFPTSALDLLHIQKR